MPDNTTPPSALTQIGFAPMPAVARVLSQFDRPQLAGFVEVAISLLDIAVGDPDREEDDPPESDGADQGDPAWVEWDKMHGSQKGGPNIIGNHEDDEDDDPAEPNGDEADSNNAEDELLGCAWVGGPGCNISDPGGCEHDGREPDHGAEVETWAHPDDHPAELFIGRRPANADNPPDAA